MAKRFCKYGEFIYNENDEVVAAIHGGFIVFNKDVDFDEEVFVQMLEDTELIEDRDDWCPYDYEGWYGDDYDEDCDYIEWPDEDEEEEYEPRFTVENDELLDHECSFDGVYCGDVESLYYDCLKVSVRDISDAITIKRNAEEIKHDVGCCRIEITFVEEV